MNLSKLLTFILIFLIVSGYCAAQTLPVFNDVTKEAGINIKHSYGDFDLSNIVEGTGAGAMFFDYDGDGWLDIYFANGSWLKTVNDNRGRKLRGKLSNTLYRNNGNGTFKDVTKEAGVGDKGFGFGCSAADFDNDGDLDLYVLNYGPNVLYRNNGDGTFTDISKESGLAVLLPYEVISKYKLTEFHFLEVLIEKINDKIEYPDEERMSKNYWPDDKMKLTLGEKVLGYLQALYR